MVHLPKPIKPESRVPVYGAIVAAALLHLALPAEIAPGPNWLPLGIAIPMVIPYAVANQCGLHNKAVRRIGTLAMVALTVFLVGALGALMFRILTQPSNHHEATLILRAALPLWMGNVFVFALWYWRLDAGGPHVREGGHALPHGFAFPQMMMDDDQRKQMHAEHWTPKFIDYLFLSFNTSTAFSPTDTVVLRSWAKIMNMIQTVISLSLLVVVAARAVNIL